ncbi:MAG TPA: hypothetical protein VF148_14070 [Acidimicrobiia bacterium]
MGPLIGALAGYFSLLIFGLSEAAPPLGTEVTGGRVGAAVLSDPPDAVPAVGVDGGRGAAHGAGFVIHRAAGIEYPMLPPRK